MCFIDSILHTFITDDKYQHNMFPRKWKQMCPTQMEIANSVFIEKDKSGGNG